MELASPSQEAEAPVVFEEEIPQNGTFRVLAVWDEFRSVPPENRGRLIMDAYLQTDPGRGRRISFPVGVTRAEGVRGGYLPYAVVTTIRATDPVDRHEVRQAMRESGAWETPAGLQLRFPFKSLAERALEQLQARFGAQYFALAEDLGPVGKWLGKSA